MPEDHLDRIEIAGFASIREAAVDLRALNVLVGANGSGKSNFIRVFELLGRLVEDELRLFVARNGGASNLLTVAGGRHLQVALRGRSGEAENRYRAHLAPADDVDDSLFFVSEEIGYRRPPYAEWWSTPIGNGHRESRLLATVAAGERGRLVATYVAEMLRGCRVYHFHDTSSSAPMKAPVSTADNLQLRPDAANIAAVLQEMRDSDQPAKRLGYRRIEAAVRLVAPFFGEFVLTSEKSDRVRLRWRERDSDAVFSAHQMSDGTLRFVCLSTLLLQSELPAVVVLDEPELGLHPFAIVQLAGMLRKAATRSQVVVATQSVTLMNEFALDDLIVVERGAGGTTFVRPDPDRLRAWLEEYSLGELWEKNLIGGRPGSVPGLPDA